MNSVRVGSVDERVTQDHHLLGGNITVVRVGKSVQVITDVKIMTVFVCLGKKNYRLIKWK